MIGLCSFALHAQSYAGLWEAGGAGSKEEFAANGSEADGENLPESRVGKNAPQMLKAYICREAYQERLTRIACIRI